jgi:hypothetical protein
METAGVEVDSGGDCGIDGPLGGLLLDDTRPLNELGAAENARVIVVV